MSDTVEKIAGEIGRHGVITFERFMELALYCPDCGYYEKEKDIVGRDGDFYTSVSVGSLFGELLAFQFAEWLEAEAGSGKSEIGDRAPEFRIVEAGAHDGWLAADILRSLRDWRKNTFDRLEYWIVEPSARRRKWQQEGLEDFREVVRWVPEISMLEATLQSSPAIIFSNELLDAMPVRRIGWDARKKKWFEWGVVLEAGNFAWSRMPDNRSSEFRFHGNDFRELSEVLPDGFITELNPAAEKWWREAARALKKGKLLTIDYGLHAEDFFLPERKDGTLRAYYRHHVSNDVLANPGEQDITAQVNFSAIQTAGETEGLRTEALLSQAKFLATIAERAWRRGDGLGEWTGTRARQFQTLTHPEHLGRSFRVLVQAPTQRTV